MHKFNPEILDPRRAGLVERYHTWPKIRRQDVASHSWQNIRILLAIWPDAPKNLIIYAMFHDIGEVGTGDMPWPMKNLNPEIGAAMDAGERLVHEGMVERFFVPPPVEISDFEHLVFKTCEYIEVWEWGWMELNLGNCYAELVRQNMLALVSGNLDKIEEVETQMRLHDGVRKRAAIYIDNRQNYEIGIYSKGDF